MTSVNQIVGSPAGVLFMKQADSENFHCAAAWKTLIWPEDEVSPDDDAASFMLARQWIIDTTELARDPDMYDGLDRPAWLGTFPDALLVAPFISNE